MTAERRLELVRYCKQRGWFGVPLDRVMRADADLDEVEAWLTDLDQKTEEAKTALRDEQWADQGKSMTETGGEPWTARIDGWQRRDALDRLIRARTDEAHGLLLSIDGKSHVYLDWDGLDALNRYAAERRPTTADSA